ncbi:hypothetical protein KP509_04G082800 [Ceratopteris richardii]|uniref:Uncharacterized protein n=1 Tax=Ceratopteris richardii TaxID=49495 RepID=A0A8T2V1X0_CERRI|nr:hypothetical protein KP509_04G082800 [Ceratopteris richardii]
MPWVPTCVECGVSDNPCRCKIFGPTLALAALSVVAVFAWPIGGIVYLVNRSKGRELMGLPVDRVYPAVNSAIPI